MISPLALIIADGKTLTDTFTLGLQTAAFETELVRDGDTALTYLAATTPELVVLDLDLPHLSGACILQHIRTDERLKKTKVIVATADPFSASTVGQDANLILFKPICQDRLRDLAVRLRPLNR